MITTGIERLVLLLLVGQIGNSTIVYSREYKTETHIEGGMMIEVAGIESIYYKKKIVPC